MTPWLTTEQAAAALQCSARHLVRLATSSRVRHLKLGPRGPYRFRLDWLEEDLGHGETQNNEHVRMEADGHRLPVPPRERRQVQIRIQRPKAIEKTLPKGTTEKEARAKVSELRAQLEAECAAQPPKIEIDTVEDFAKRWRERRRHLRASTRRTDESAIWGHVLPAIGHMPAADVTGEDFEDLVATLLDERKPDGETYSRDTIRTWFRAARKLFKALAKAYRIPDPTEGVASPRAPRDGGKRQERGTLTAEQLGQVIDAAQVHFPDRAAEVIVLALTGMRAGELYALRFEDVEVERSRPLIHVRWSYSRGEVNTTKTDEPREIVPPKLVIDTIQAQRERLMREQHIGLKLGIVFPSDTGTHRDSASIRKVLGQIADHLHLGQRLTPQVLRRTYNTLLVADGVDRLVLRSQIGHTSEEMTGRYMGTTYEMKAEVAARLEAMVLAGR